MEARSDAIHAELSVATQKYWLCAVCGGLSCEWIQELGLRGKPPCDRLLLVFAMSWIA
ncbi:protein of unknown function [Kyrpidia spormannii]|nr:protein of unknown function [Kyrpidia spormannii]